MRDEGKNEDTWMDMDGRWNEGKMDFNFFLGIIWSFDMNCVPFSVKWLEVSTPPENWACIHSLGLVLTMF